MSSKGRNSILFTKEEYSLFIAPYERVVEHVLVSIGDYKKELELQSKQSHFPIILDEPRYRIKTYESAIEKCQRKTGKKSVSIDMIRENILDIAGIRLITDFEDNVFEIADALSSRLRLNVVATKDYINSPKPSGYRSLHIIVQRELHFNGKTSLIPIEIQIRTHTMDFWSKLEHKLQYKSANPCPETEQAFKEISKIAIDIDKKAMVLRDLNKSMIIQNPPI